MLVLLAAPAAAQEARYDLAVQRFLEEQSRAVAESGTILEDWLYGRLSNARVAAKLGERQDAVEAWAEKLEAAPYPPGLAEYRRGALACSAAHRRAVERLSSFVARGKNDRKSIESFASSLSQDLVGNARTWLRLRHKWLPRLSAGKARGYYDWQSKVLPLQVRQVDLVGKVQQLIYRGAADDADYRRLGQEAEGVLAEVRALRADAARVQGGGPAQAAYLQELESLEKLAEAVSLMGRDPSEDASSRLRRCSRAVVAQSRATQDAALDLLESRL